jgi:hypothetical protein
MKIKCFKINKKKILILNQPRTAGINMGKGRVSLTKPPSKGYRPSWVVDPAMNGRD